MSLILEVENAASYLLPFIKMKCSIFSLCMLNIGRNFVIIKRYFQLDNYIEEKRYKHGANII